MKSYTETVDFIKAMISSLQTIELKQVILKDFVYEKDFTSEIHKSLKDRFDSFVSNSQLDEYTKQQLKASFDINDVILSPHERNITLSVDFFGKISYGYNYIFKRTEYKDVYILNNSWYELNEDKDYFLSTSQQEQEDKKITLNNLAQACIEISNILNKYNCEFISKPQLKSQKSNISINY